MKILVTGAAGTVGFETLKQLVSICPECKILAFDLKNKKNKKRLSFFKDKIKIIFGDITDFQQVAKIGKNIDFVIHLAAIIPPLADENTDLAYMVNVLGTKNLIKHLEKNSGQAKIIYGSSIAVYGDRIKKPLIKVTDSLKPAEGDFYAQTKIQAENIIKNSKLKWSIFRLTAIFGIKNHKISKIMFNMPLDTPMEIITPEDAARAFAKGVFNWDKIENKIFNLSGGEKCRIIYKNFLKKSFEIYGLGKFRFPVTAFALQNFHCGYYFDNQDLENILHFQKDTIETYFKKVKENLNPLTIFLTRIFSPLIQKILLKKSEPYKALLKGEKEKILRFFGNFFIQRSSLFS